MFAKHLTTLILGLITGFTSFSQPFADNWLSQSLPWRNIGPANMMGRIAMIDALNTNYRHVIIGTASGGVYKSTNGGITWDVIFDKYGACSIGSVALFQSNPDIIWVGTGESANRNSSGWGNGLFKSSDGGKTFQYMGFEDSHHIAGIATHPTDPNIAYVASVGHLWGYNGERGLYKTTDGGKTWAKLTNGLPDDGKTGCTDIKMHPTKPNILYAGFYERLREPYYYKSGGDNGGIFQSTNGGKSWTKLTNGLPKGATGMIDISIHHKNPNIIVAAVEADEKIPGHDEEGYHKNNPGTGVYRTDDGGKTWRWLYKHAVRPFYHGQIEIDPIDPNNIYIVSRGFEISNDGGKTFKPRRWRTDGGDDHDMWIAPYDNNIMYLATDQGLRLSVDGGKTILSHNNMAIGQYYAINTDMRDPYWVIGGLQDNGLWMGPSNSREYRGILNEHNTWVGEGDGFYCAIDPIDNRTIYLVNHVGFATRLDFYTREYQYITPNPETIINYKDFVDPNYPETPIRYTIDPGEHWFFGGREERPKLPPQFRFNWNSPLVLSPSNSHTLYFGGNHLFKSVDRGNTWRIISPDLTSNDPKRRNPTNSGYLTRSVTGGENHYTIVTIAESPLDPSVIWVGTDDGHVQITQNGGISWTDVKPNILGVPANAWVSRVEPSHHEPGTCYVTFDNHRYDDYKPYVFKTTDFGKTWTDISNNLPDGWSLYVVREDIINPNLLFVGSENAVHVSVNGGNNWEPLMNNLPTVAIYDMMIHPRDGDLIAGTHGRSIWILDDITPLQQMTPDIQQKDIHLFHNRTATKWLEINTGRKQPSFEFRGYNPRNGAYINFYVKNAAAKDTALVTVESFTDAHKITFKTPVNKGINRAYWNFMFPVTEGEVKAYREHLSSVIQQLKQLVQKSDLQTLLTNIENDLSKAGNLRDLNGVRSELVENFNAYAEGKPFFGERLSFHEAEAGRYKVTVEVAGKTASGFVEVREDPMLREGK